MRDKRIDLLRFIGVSSLIMAHVAIPAWLFQLRNYNVPLIVMASAMALSHSSGLKEDYWHFVSKRVKRLLFPVWLFLTFFFIVLALTGLDPRSLTAQHIWDCYTLGNSGGFMWIFRVFLLVALLAPFIYRLNQKIQSDRVYLNLLLAGYIGYEGVLYLLDFMPEGPVSFVIDSLVCYALGYGLIFAFGMRLQKLTAKDRWAVGALAFCVFAVLCVHHYVQEGHFVQTQEYKYPPSAYYVSYAMAASLVTWWASKYICAFLNKLPRLEAILMFIAQNSMWVYLWHTLFLYVAYRLHQHHYLIQYFAVYALSALTVFIQVWVVQNWILPRISDEPTRKDVKVLLAG